MELQGWRLADERQIVDEGVTREMDKTFDGEMLQRQFSNCH